MQMGQRPANLPKDDRLDLASVGKCRSDPARMRAQTRQRGRGRHSLDIGRDLKRPLTIDETVRPLHTPSHARCSPLGGHATTLYGNVLALHLAYNSMNPSVRAPSPEGPSLRMHPACWRLYRHCCKKWCMGLSLGAARAEAVPAHH